MLSVWWVLGFVNTCNMIIVQNNCVEDHHRAKANSVVLSISCISKIMAPLVIGCSFAAILGPESSSSFVSASYYYVLAILSFVCYLVYNVNELQRLHKPSLQKEAAQPLLESRNR